MKYFLHPINILIIVSPFSFQYFVNYKLGKEYTETPLPYATYFLQYVGFAAQIPNLVFNWINIFLNLG